MLDVQKLLLWLDEMVQVEADFKRQNDYIAGRIDAYSNVARYIRSGNFDLKDIKGD